MTKIILIQIESNRDFDEIQHCLNQNFSEAVVKEVTKEEGNNFFIFPQVWKLSRENRKVVDILYRKRVETYDLRESWTEKKIKESNQTPDFKMLDYDDEYYHNNGFRKVASGSRKIRISKDDIDKTMIKLAEASDKPTEE